jgi:uncharacterized protein YebE (UPF0316 family)
MSTTILLDAVKMGALALVSVGLWTLRVALTARGRRVAGAATAAVEASVFALVFASLVSDLDNPARIGGYALGVALGTLLGISADKRMSRGQSDVRLVVEGSGAALLDALRGRGWPATAMAANGLRGPATVVFISVDDQCISSLLDDVQRLAPDAFWTVERLQAAHAMSLEAGCVS